MYTWQVSNGDGFSKFCKRNSDSYYFSNAWLQNWKLRKIILKKIWNNHIIKYSSIIYTTNQTLPSYQYCTKAARHQQNPYNIHLSKSRGARNRANWIKKDEHTARASRCLRFSQARARAKCVSNSPVGAAVRRERGFPINIPRHFSHTSSMLRQTRRLNFPALLARFPRRALLYLFGDVLPNSSLRSTYVGISATD